MNYLSTTSVDDLSNTNIFNFTNFLKALEEASYRSRVKLPPQEICIIPNGGGAEEIEYFLEQLKKIFPYIKANHSREIKLVKPQKYKEMESTWKNKELIVKYKVDDGQIIPIKFTRNNGVNLFNIVTTEEFIDYVFNEAS